VSSQKRFPESETFYASCVARDGDAILLCGPSGSGKSTLALQLMERGFSLVSDDRVQMNGRLVSPPSALEGLLEVRGVGIIRTPFVTNARVILKVLLGMQGDRLPTPEKDQQTGAVVLHINGCLPGDSSRVMAAFQACRGTYDWVTGAGGDTAGI